MPSDTHVEEFLNYFDGSSASLRIIKEVPYCTVAQSGHTYMQLARSPKESASIATQHGSIHALKCSRRRSEVAAFLFRPPSRCIARRSDLQCHYSHDGDDIGSLLLP